MIKNMQIRLTEIGKIKIGGKGEEKISSRGNKFRAPKKQDYFTVTRTVRDEQDNFTIDKDIHEKVGPRPTSLDIFFMFDDMERNFLTSYSMYVGKKCVCRGDGETAERTDKEGKKETVTCPCEFLNGVNKDGINYVCKPSGLLLCMLKVSNRIGGVHTFRTHSWNSIQNIMASYQQLSMMTGGLMAGIPFKLVLMAKTQQDKTGATRTLYVVNLEYEGDLSKLRREAAENAKIRGTLNQQIIDHKYLAQQFLNESPKEAEEIQNEFFPENIDAKELPATPAPQEVKEQPEPEGAKKEDIKEIKQKELL